MELHVKANKPFRRVSVIIRMGTKYIAFSAPIFASFFFCSNKKFKWYLFYDVSMVIATTVLFGFFSRTLRYFMRACSGSLHFVIWKFIYIKLRWINGQKHVFSIANRVEQGKDRL